MNKTTSRAELLKKSIKKNASIKDSSEGWAASAAKQRSLEAKPLNTKYLPLKLIDIDPTNARINSLSKEDLLNGPKVDPMITDDGWFDTFEQEVIKFFDGKHNAKHKVDDYFRLAELALSIGRPEDLIQAISVYPSGSRFKVNSGNCRVMAHYLLNAAFIAAIIKDSNDSELKKAVKQYQENIHRVDYTLIEEVRAVIKVKEEYERKHNKALSRNSLMQETRLKRTKAGDILAIVKLYQTDQVFKDAIENKLLSSLDIAQKIAREKDKESRDSIIHCILNGKNPYSNNQKPVPKEQQQQVVKPQLKITKKMDTYGVSLLLKYALEHPSLHNRVNSLGELDLKSSKGLKEAWNNIIELLTQSESKG